MYIHWSTILYIFVELKNYIHELSTPSISINQVVLGGRRLQKSSRFRSLNEVLDMNAPVALVLAAPLHEEQ